MTCKSITIFEIFTTNWRTSKNVIVRTTATRHDHFQLFPNKFGINWDK